MGPLHPLPAAIGLRRAAGWILKSLDIFISLTHRGLAGGTRQAFPVNPANWRGDPLFVAPARASTPLAHGGDVLAAAWVEGDHRETAGLTEDHGAGSGWAWGRDGLPRRVGMQGSAALGRQDSRWGGGSSSGCLSSARLPTRRS